MPTAPEPSPWGGRLLVIAGAAIAGAGMVLIPALGPLAVLATPPEPCGLRPTSGAT